MDTHQENQKKETRVVTKNPNVCSHCGDCKEKNNGNANAKTSKTSPWDEFQIAILSRDMKIASTASFIEQDIISKQRKEIMLLMEELRTRDKELNDLVRSHQAQVKTWVMDRKKLTDLQQRLGDYEQDLQRSDEQLQLTIGEMKQASSQKEIDDQELMQTRKKMETLSQKINENSFYLKKLESQNKNLLGTVKELHRTKEKLENKGKELESQLQKKTEKLTSQSELMEKNKNLECRLLQTEEKLSNSKTEAVAWKKKYCLAKDESDRQTRELNEKDVNIKNLTGQLHETLQQTMALQKSLFTTSEREKCKDDLMKSLKTQQKRTMLELSNIRSLYERQTKDEALYHLSIVDDNREGGDGDGMNTPARQEPEETGQLNTQREGNVTRNATSHPNVKPYFLNQESRGETFLVKKKITGRSPKILDRCENAAKTAISTNYDEAGTRSDDISQNEEEGKQEKRQHESVKRTNGIYLSEQGRQTRSNKPSADFQRKIELSSSPPLTAQYLEKNLPCDSEDFERKRHIRSKSMSPRRQLLDQGHRTSPRRQVHNRGCSTSPKRHFKDRASSPILHFATAKNLDLHHNMNNFCNNKYTGQRHEQSLNDNKKGNIEKDKEMLRQGKNEPVKQHHNEHIKQHHNEHIKQHYSEQVYQHHNESVKQHQNELIKQHHNEPLKHHNEPLKQQHNDPVKEQHNDLLKQHHNDPVKQHHNEPVKHHNELLKQHTNQQIKQHSEPVKQHHNETSGVCLSSSDCSTLSLMDEKTLGELTPADSDGMCQELKSEFLPTRDESLYSFHGANIPTSHTKIHFNSSPATTPEHPRDFSMRNKRGWSDEKSYLIKDIHSESYSEDQDDLTVLSRQITKEIHCNQVKDDLYSTEKLFTSNSGGSRTRAGGDSGSRKRLDESNNKSVGRNVDSFQAEKKDKDRMYRDSSKENALSDATYYLELNEVSNTDITSQEDDQRGSCDGINSLDSYSSGIGLSCKNRLNGVSENMLKYCRMPLTDQEDRKSYFIEESLKGEERVSYSYETTSPLSRGSRVDSYSWSGSKRSPLSKQMPRRLNDSASIQKKNETSQALDNDKMPVYSDKSDLGPSTSFKSNEGDLNNVSIQSSKMSTLNNSKMRINSHVEKENISSNPENGSKHFFTNNKGVEENSRANRVKSRATDVHSRVSDVHSRATDVHSRVSDVHSRATDVKSRVSDVPSRVSDANMNHIGRREYYYEECSSSDSEAERAKKNDRQNDNTLERNTHIPSIPSRPFLSTKAPSLYKLLSSIHFSEISNRYEWVMPESLQGSQNQQNLMEEREKSEPSSSLVSNESGITHSSSEKSYKRYLDSNMSCNSNSDSLIGDGERMTKGLGGQDSNPCVDTLIMEPSPTAANMDKFHHHFNNIVKKLNFSNIALTDDESNLESDLPRNNNQPFTSNLMAGKNSRNNGNAIQKLEFNKCVHDAADASSFSVLNSSSKATKLQDQNESLMENNIVCRLDFSDSTSVETSRLETVVSPHPLNILCPTSSEQCVDDTFDDIKTEKITIALSGVEGVLVCTKSKECVQCVSRIDNCFCGICDVAGGSNNKPPSLCSGNEKAVGNVSVDDKLSMRTEGKHYESFSPQQSLPHLQDEWAVGEGGGDDLNGMMSLPDYFPDISSVIADDDSSSTNGEEGLRKPEALISCQGIDGNLVYETDDDTLERSMDAMDDATPPHNKAHSHTSTSTPTRKQLAIGNNAAVCYSNDLNSPHGRRTPQFVEDRTLTMKRGNSDENNCSVGNSEIERCMGIGKSSSHNVGQTDVDNACIVERDYCVHEFIDCSNKETNRNRISKDEEQIIKMEGWNVNSRISHKADRTEDVLTKGKKSVDFDGSFMQPDKMRQWRHQQCEEETGNGQDVDDDDSLFISAECTKTMETTSNKTETLKFGLKGSRDCKKEQSNEDGQVSGSKDTFEDRLSTFLEDSSLDENQEIYTSNVAMSPASKLHLLLVESQEMIRSLEKTALKKSSHS